MPVEYKNVQRTFKNTSFTYARTDLHWALEMYWWFNKKTKQIGKQHPPKHHCFSRLGKAHNWKIQAWYCVRGQVGFQRKQHLEKEIVVFQRGLKNQILDYWSLTRKSQSYLCWQPDITKENKRLLLIPTQAKLFIVWGLNNRSKFVYAGHFITIFGWFKCFLLCEPIAPGNPLFLNMKKCNFELWLY